MIMGRCFWIFRCTRICRNIVGLIWRACFLSCWRRERTYWWMPGYDVRWGWLPLPTSVPRALFERSRSSKVINTIPRILFNGITLRNLHLMKNYLRKNIMTNYSACCPAVCLVILCYHHHHRHLHIIHLPLLQSTFTTVSIYIWYLIQFMMLISSAVLLCFFKGMVFVLYWFVLPCLKQNRNIAILKFLSDMFCFDNVKLFSEYCVKGNT